MKPVYGFDRVIRPDPGFKIKQAPACHMKCSGDRLEERRSIQRGCQNEDHSHLWTVSTGVRKSYYTHEVYYGVSISWYWEPS